MNKKIYESPDMELISVVDVIRTSDPNTNGPYGWGTEGGYTSIALDIDLVD